MHPAAPADPHHNEEVPTRQGRGCLPKVLVAGLLLALAAIGLFAAWTVYGAALGPYRDRIYPNVTVLDVDLGGLTADEAAERLAEVASGYDAGSLILSDGARTWAVPWSEAGLRLDVDATVQRAFAVGRAERGIGNLLTILSMREGRYEVTPAFTVDPVGVRSVLTGLAAEVAVPPSDATLRLEGDQLVAVPGQPGRVLDVDPTLDNIVAAVTHLGPDNQFALAFQPVAPRLADTNAVQAQAEEMLNRQVQISSYDWLTDETFTWTLARETVVTWLRVEQAEDGNSPSVRIDEETVQATLAGLAAQMGNGRDFRLAEATRQVLDVFEAGGGTVEVGLTHPQRSYVVQAGDDLTSIAARFGVPPGLVAEVNPDIDLNLLRVDQELAIPSEDAVKPYAPVPGKRIVINIAEQRMQVYENDALIHEWPVSTGIARSPTYTGEFQILSKSENAYASQWDLWMPHFLAVYRAGGDTYNGIHALPILSNGQRLWAGSLGSPCSYGCIILGIEEAELLYNWAEIGVPVTIE